LQRLTAIKFKQAGGTITAYSPIKRRMVVYSKCQALATSEPFEYDLTALKNDFNTQLATQSIDAYVEECKKIRTTFQDNLIVDLWVGGESPLDPATVILVIALIIAIVAGVCVVLSSTASFVERIFPQVKFYTPDGKVFDTLAEYLTYMQNVYNPTQGKSYTCPYCGQGFATAEEEATHEANCPWKNGVPTAGTNWVGALTGLLIVAGLLIGAVLIVPRVLDLFKGPSPIP
jgi:hypothetical protein